MVRHGILLVRGAFPREASCRPFVPSLRSNSISVANTICSDIPRQGVHGASTSFLIATESGKSLLVVIDRRSATPNDTVCRPHSRIRRLGSTGSTSDFGISVSLAISSTTSTFTVWIPRSDGKVLHQPQTSLASDGQHQTDGRSDRPLPWRACSAEMGRPRYVRTSYMQQPSPGAFESLSHSYQA